MELCKAYCKLYYVKMTCLMSCRYREFKFVGCRYNSNSSSLIQQEPERNYVSRKFNEIVKWYEQLTGMDEVRMMQNRVLEAQDKFMSCQEKRRYANKELANIQSRLKDIYSELDTTNRGEERYLHLVTQEHVLLKEERRIAADFAQREQAERDSFSLLSACVKESHEKERAQAERTKYWSVIGSVVGTIIGVVASSISNEFKMKELRSLVRGANESPQHSIMDVKTSSVLSNHEEQLSVLVREMKAMVKGATEKSENGVVRRIDELLHTIANRENAYSERNLASHVAELQRSIDEVKSLLSSAQRYDGHLIAIPADIESIIKQQKKETRNLLVGVSLVAIILPVLIAYLQRL